MVSQSLTLRNPIARILFLCTFFVITTLEAKTTVSLIGGSAYNQVGLSMLVISPTETDRLSNDINYDLVQGFGIEQTLPMKSLPLPPPKIIEHIDLGLFYIRYIATNTGHVWLYGLPNLANYHFRLKHQTNRIMLATTLWLHPLKNAMRPFIYLGAGGVHINTRYVESPKLEEGTTDGELVLARKKRINFAYSLGAGIEKPLSKKISVRLQYRFTQFGNSNTSREARQVRLVRHIKTELKTHAALVSLAYTLQ